MSEVARASSQAGYNQVPGAHQMRTDTQRMLSEVEAFLRGKRITHYVQHSDGSVEPQFTEKGLPLMNERGIQNMMNSLNLMFNPHTVQGNLTREEFWDFITEVSISIRRRVMTNLHAWEVDINNYNTICEDITFTSIAFFSRLIDNEERKSYIETLKIMDRSGGEKSNSFLKSNE